MKFKFKEVNSDVTKRKAEASKIREKYPERIPVIIEKDPNSKMLDIDKTKFLVASELNSQHLICIVRKRLELSKEASLFMLINGKVSVTGETPLSELYEKFKDPEDGFLYIVYTSELTWG